MIRTKKGRWSIVLASILTLALTLSAAGAEEYEARLSFTPYSSTYLARKWGNLTEKRGISFGSLAWMLDPAVIASAKATSTMNRFDLARASILGKTTRMEPVIRSSHYDTKAELWEGFCDRWSASSSNEEINQLLEQSQGLFCDQYILSRGEMKELFTGLSVWEGVDAFYGTRVENSFSAAEKAARTELGIDDLPAHVFHQQLYDNLRANRAVVMDKSPERQVWNQPIFEAHSTAEVTPINTGIFSSQLVPWREMESEDTETQKQLERIVQLDKAIHQLVLNLNDVDENGIPQRQLKEDENSSYAKMYRKALASRNQAIDALAQKMSERQGMVASKLWPKVREGKIALKPGYRMKRVDTTVKYGREFWTYAREDYTKVRSVKYSYYLVEDQRGNVVNSLWITSPTKRPDFIWVPDYTTIKEIRKAKARGEDVGATLDLVSLMEKCLDLKEVVAFFDSLQTTQAGSPLTSGEKAELRKAYSRVRPVINQQEVAKRLGPGLSMQDLE